MKTFSNFELKTFEQLASLSQSSLKKVLASFLPRHYSKVIETEDYIFAEGTIPIALTAHMDTIFKQPPQEIFFDPAKNVMWSPDGLGADDRAGIFAILQIIRAGYRPHIIFTTDEEIGGLGAMSLATLDCPFKDLKYIIELDRRGSNDCVFYECENPKFNEYIEKFGFEYNFGSYTDICEFCPLWEVAGVNLSIGYRDEHTYGEVLFVGQMFSTIEKVKHMLEDAENLKEPFEYIPAITRAYDWGLGIGTRPAVIKCYHCGKYFMEEELFPIVMLDGSTQFYCPDCLVEHAAWCDVCGSAYQKASTKEAGRGICLKCKELKNGTIGAN